MGTVGSITYIMYKLLIVSCLSAVALAAPEAEADAGYLGYAPALPNAYPDWPGYSGPGFSRTIYGARSYAYGKRSADAEPGYAPAVYNSYPAWPGVSAPGFSSTLYGARPYTYGKRSADAEPGYGVRAYAPYGVSAYGLTGVAGHPTGTSFVARSPQGLSLRGKRSADAEPEADADAAYAVAAYPYAYAPALYNSPPNWPGVAGPGFSSTVYGLRGKRSADAESDAYYGGYGYPLGYRGYGYGGLYGYGRRYYGGYYRGKRSADAEPEADAYYGGYGYGRGYGYPLAYRGYGYGGYGYGRGYY